MDNNPLLVSPTSVVRLFGEAVGLLSSIHAGGKKVWVNTLNLLVSISLDTAYEWRESKQSLKIIVWKSARLNGKVTQPGGAPQATNR